MPDDANNSAHGHPQGNQGATFTDSLGTGTIPILVGAEWEKNGVQLCPAIFLHSLKQISSAVKYVYSKLAACSEELDEGIPHLVLSLVGTGNSFSHEEHLNLVSGLCKIVNKCGVWIVISGERHDPLATATAESLRSVLPQEESAEETLVIVVNSADVAYRGDQSSSTNGNAISSSSNMRMVDSCLNTMYLIWNRENPASEEMLTFRTCTATKLAIPPPALLIGVPDERSISNVSQAPLSPTAQAILLPSANRTAERRPLAATLNSLLELHCYLQCGVPVLVVQDASNLCTLLRASFVLYQQAGFNYLTFISWLDVELRKIAAATTVEPHSRSALVKARNRVCKIITSAFHNSTQINVSFIAAEELNELPAHLLQLLLRNATATANSGSISLIMGLAVKLNCPPVLSSMSLEMMLDRQTLQSLVKEALIGGNRIDVLVTLLEQTSHAIRVDSDMLLEWSSRISDQYFFSAIVLGYCLGYKRRPDKITEHTVSRVNKLLSELSGGLSPNLFKPECLVHGQPQLPGAGNHGDDGKSMQTMAIWALLLNRAELVKLFCAYSAEPIALSMVLAKIARSLARRSRGWCVSYEKQLLDLSEYLNSQAVGILDQAHKESPTKAYRALCRRLGSSFGGMTLTQLAYECNAKDFIAHACCQRWMRRLLHGNLQLNTLNLSLLGSLGRLPNWLKIVLSSLLVLPIHWWVGWRPTRLLCTAIRPSRTMSPTVALLEEGRRPRKVTRSSSSYSVHSVRSGSIYGVNRIRGEEQKQPASATMLQVEAAQQTPLVDDTDSFVFTNYMVSRPNQTELQPNNRPEEQPQETWSSHSTSPSLNRSRDGPARRSKTKQNDRAGFLDKATMFYSTAITKYWLSLVVRIIYLLALSYTVTSPGCGPAIFGVLLWLWAFMWLAESLLLLNAQPISVGENVWMIFDIACLSALLFSILLLRVSATYFPTLTAHFASAYVLKGIWTVLLLYECYKTLFVYIPMSDILGPFLLRIRLMLTRDFPYFLLFSLLFIFSSTMAIKTVVYPDDRFDVAESLSWASMSFFTSDLSLLNESEHCHRSLLSNERKPYCVAVSGYADPSCPKSGWFAHLVVLEYLFILKFIAFPILFALFARSARMVDREADRIWKYQIYSLATQFNRRLPLPPPFTPLVLAAVLCCRCSGRLANAIRYFVADSSDHPDMGVGDTPPLSREQKYSNVYRNPSVPFSKNLSQNNYWTRLAIELWKRRRDVGQPSLIHESSSYCRRRERRMEEKLQLLLMLGHLHASPAHAQQEHGVNTPNEEMEGDQTSSRVAVASESTSWDVLLPDYCPPSYSREFERIGLKRDAEENVTDELAYLTDQWRRKRLAQLTNGIDEVVLSALSLPLNPMGRTGMSGRGNYPKYGPNKVYCYVVLSLAANSGPALDDGVEEEKDGTQPDHNEKQAPRINVLIESTSRDLPCAYEHDVHRPDEQLHRLLMAAGVPDADSQAITSRASILAVGQKDGRLAHVLVRDVHLQDATDNAWSEADVWAADLSGISALNQRMDEYEWHQAGRVNAWLPDKSSEEFVKESLKLFGL